MRYLYWFIFTLLLLDAGCSSGRPDDMRLIEISEHVSESPEKMLERLDSIDVASLGESDRWFHALMRIKAQDKAFVRHTSDSVILRVIDYYSRHPKSGLYPEALYYGGRVYSDIGDAPTALRCFQDALDALPEGKDDDLRSRILSQTGNLLNSLRLHNEAVSYLRSATMLFLQKKDSLNAMRNIQLLGAVYMHACRLDSADSCFREAYKIAVGISHRDTVIQKMYLAGTQLYRGNISEALDRIRPVVRNLPEKKRDITYAYAAQIYHDAGIPDTAYLFASKLIVSNNNDYRRNGYKMLLDPALRKYTSIDSQISYELAYERVLEEYLDSHDAQQVTVQTSLYNYHIHERERKKAEEAKKLYMYVAALALILVQVLCVVLLYLRNRKIKLQLDYRKAIDNIDRLENSHSSTEEKLKKSEKAVEELEAKKSEVEKKLRQAEERNEISDEVSNDKATAKKESEEERLRDQLKERLLVLQRAGKARKKKPEEILDPSVLARLQVFIDAEKGIAVTDGIWLEVEKAVLYVSPEFKSRLNLLIGGKMKQDLYHLALLVKCGFMPLHIGYMLGRSKSAMSSRRGYICEKIFGEKYGAKVMDDIINLL